MRRTTQHLFAITLFSLLLAAPSQAGPSYADHHEVWWPHLSEQLVRSLDSPIEQVKTQTLQHITFFATFDLERVDWRQITPRLLRIFERDTNEEHRIMALAALDAISDRPAMIHLSRLLQDEPSSKVRRLTLAVLANHFRTPSAVG